MLGLGHPGGATFWAEASIADDRGALRDEYNSGDDDSATEKFADDRGFAKPNPGDEDGTGGTR
jgi:hypothetical protein